MKLRLFLLGFCVASTVTAPVLGASLRRMTTLQGPVVYLRDLFDDAGMNANRLLGPGPAPGGRIVVEARQLKAIARQYDVEWQPASNTDRALLEWPGLPMKRDLVLATVRTALMAQGASADCDVEIPGFNPPMVPPGGEAAPFITQLDYNQGTGRFTALLLVSGGGMDPLSIHISGSVADVLELPVAVTRLSAGTIAGPDDVRMARVRAGLVHAEVAHEAGAVIGMQLKRQLAAGVPIPLAELMQPTQVTRGDPVRLWLQADGLTLEGQGVALESGAAGEQIRVRNISSQAVLEAEVVRPGVVRVLPGSAPIISQARGGNGAPRGG